MTPTTTTPTDRGITDSAVGWICSVLLLVAPVRDRDAVDAIHLLRCPGCTRRLAVWRRN